jgi:hypothetical protein
MFSSNKNLILTERRLNMNRMDWDEKQALKKSSALERQNVASKRSPTERLAILDQRLGKDKGAKKERERLEKVL